VKYALVEKRLYFTSSGLGMAHLMQMGTVIWAQFLRWGRLCNYLFFVEQSLPLGDQTK
jgi:hypothetical protein